MTHNKTAELKPSSFPKRQFPKGPVLHILYTILFLFHMRFACLVATDMQFTKFTKCNQHHSLHKYIKYTMHLMFALKTAYPFCLTKTI